MSTIRAPLPAAGIVETATRTAIEQLHRAYTAYMEARQKSVDRRVALHLEGMGDVRMLDLGFSSADVEAIRAGAPIADIRARRARRLA